MKLLRDLMPFWPSLFIAGAVFYMGFVIAVQSSSVTDWIATHLGITRILYAMLFQICAGALICISWFVKRPHPWLVIIFSSIVPFHSIAATVWVITQNPGANIILGPYWLATVMIIVAMMMWFTLRSVVILLEDDSGTTDPMTKLMKIRHFLRNY